MEDMPECSACCLQLKTEDVWEGHGFATEEDETTKWVCPKCNTVNFTIACKVTCFTTSEYEEDYDEEPDRILEGIQI